MSKRTTIAHGYMLVLLYVCVPYMVGCGPTPLEQEVQKHWPSQSPSDKRIEAIQSAYTATNRLEKPNLYFAVSRADFERFGPGALKDYVKEADGSRQGQPTLSRITIALDQQEVVTTASFDHFIKEANARVQGDAMFHAALAVEGSKIVVNPSFSSVKIKGIQVSEKADVSALAPLINAALSHFLDNINGLLANITVPINIGLMQSIDPHDLFLSVPNVASVQGPELAIMSGLGHSSILIDSDAIHVLGEVVNLDPATFSRVLEELSKSPALPNTPTSEQVAVLSLCGHSFAIEKNETADYDKFRALCSGYLSPQSSTSQRVASNSTFYQPYAFSGLKELFSNKASQVEASAQLPWKDTAVVVSKSLISDAITKFVGQPHLNVSFNLPQFNDPFNQVIKTDPAPNLECEKNSGACDINYSCDQSTDCSAVMACPSDCAWYDVPCHTWKPTCEAIKATKKGACEAAKSTARAACETKKAADKGSCEAAKSARRVGCETNQGWLNNFGSMPVGNFVGDVTLDQGAVELGVDNIAIAPDLSMMAVKGNLSAQGKINVNTKFTPYNLGNLLCAAQWTGSLAATASISKSDLNLSGDIVPTVESDKSLDLVLKTAAQNFTLKITPAPLTALLAQNPQLVFVCSGAISALSISAHLRDQALKDSFDFSLPGQAFTIKIAPQKVVIGGSSLNVYPSWNSKSIQAIAR